MFYKHHGQNWPCLWDLSGSESYLPRVRLGFRSPTSTELEHVPVKHVVVGEPLAVEKVPEQLAQVAETEGFTTEEEVI